MSTEADKEEKVKMQAETWNEAVKGFRGLVGKDVEINQSLNQQQTYSNDLKDIPNVKKEENQMVR